jgi:hypothetical protein
MVWKNQWTENEPQLSERGGSPLEWDCERYTGMPFGLTGTVVENGGPGNPEVMAAPKTSPEGRPLLACMCEIHKRAAEEAKEGDPLPDYDTEPMLLAHS